MVVCLYIHVFLFDISFVKYICTQFRLFIKGIFSILTFLIKIQIYFQHTLIVKEFLPFKVP